MLGSRLTLRKAAVIAVIAIVAGSGAAAGATVASGTAHDASSLASRENAVVSVLKAYPGPGAHLSAWEVALKSAEAQQAAAESVLNRDLSSTVTSEGGGGSSAAAPIVLTGSGQTATQPFRVLGGLTILAATCQCSENFSVEIDTSGGSSVDIPINVIGSYTGSVAEGLKGGAYILNVQADGPWRVTVTQPRNVKGIPLPHTFTGSGQQVVGPVSGGSALRLAAVNHSTQGGNFVVEIFGSDGSSQDIPFNEIGSFNGSTLSTDLSSGPYYLGVDSDGTWTITVSNG